MTTPSFDAAVQPDNVVPHRAETVPADKFHLLVATLEEKADEAAALTKALTQSNRQIRALQREIDDLLDQAADRDTVRTILDFFVKTSGRDPKRTRVDLTTGRARCVRWLLRAWTPREVCFMVVGIAHSEWYVKNGKVDVKYICTSAGKWDEAKAEEFLHRGERVLGVSSAPRETS